MPICAPGTSVAKPGYQPIIAMGSAAIEAALLEAGITGGTAVVIAAILAGLSVVIAQYCNIDPPPDPVLTQTDFQNAVNVLNPVLSIPAQKRIQQWFLHWYWWQVCECSGATTPAQPALTVPTNIEPSAGIPGRSNAPCFDLTYTATIAGTPTLGVPLDITQQVLPITGVSKSGAGAIYGMTAYGSNTTCWPIPPVTAINFRSTCIAFDPMLSGSNLPVVSLNFWDSTPTHLGGFTLIQGGSSFFNNYTVFPGEAGIWPAAATYMQVAEFVTQPAGDTNPNTFTIEAIGTCGGGSLLQPCCPEDPVTQQQLGQLLQLVQAIYQAQTAPLRSFASGTVHTALSSSGQIALSPGTIAIQVNITTDPGGRIDTGNPSYLFNRGYLVTLAYDTPIRGLNRIVYNPQFFDVHPLADHIGYTLPAGEVISITELSAGP